MSRRRIDNRQITQLHSSSNMIDFVDNRVTAAGEPLQAYPAGMDDMENEGLHSCAGGRGVTEGPPAFLDAQGIRYVPAPTPLESYTRASPPSPLPQHMSEPIASPADVVQRVNRNVRAYMQGNMGTQPLPTRVAPPLRRGMPFPPSWDEVPTPRRSMARPTSLAAPVGVRWDEDTAVRHRLNALHAEIMASDEHLSDYATAHHRLKALHAEIKESTPAGLSSESAVPYDATYDVGDSDDEEEHHAHAAPGHGLRAAPEHGLCQVIRPPRMSRLI